VSLRKALIALPDDRSTMSAVHGVITYLDTHPEEPFDLRCLTRRTGLDDMRIERVLCALADAYVIDCDGDPRSTSCTYKPDSVLALEVRRFLRTSGGIDIRLQRGVDRFRGRHSAGI